MVEKRLERISKQLRSGDKSIEAEHKFLEKVYSVLSDSKLTAKLANISDEENLYETVTVSDSKTIYLYC